jgi:hypothetical protein
LVLVVLESSVSIAVVVVVVVALSTVVDILDGMVVLLSVADAVVLLWAGTLAVDDEVCAAAVVEVGSGVASEVGSWVGSEVTSELSG